MKAMHQILSSFLVALLTAGAMVAGQSIAADAGKGEKLKCVTAHDIKNMTQEEFDRIYNTGG